jgi:outer membrane protein
MRDRVAARKRETDLSKSIVRMMSCVALTLAISLPATAALAAETTIGYVNLARALTEVKEGKRAMARIKVTFEKKQTALLSQEAGLKSMKDQLDAASASGSPDRAKMAEFEAKVMELQQLLYREQQELEQIKGKELAAIRKKMQKIIAKVGKSNGYTLILEIQESRLLYAKPHLDLTNEVIRKYNNKFK